MGIFRLLSRTHATSTSEAYSYCTTVFLCCVCPIYAYCSWHLRTPILLSSPRFWDTLLTSVRLGRQEARERAPFTSSWLALGRGFGQAQSKFNHSGVDQRREDLPCVGSSGPWPIGAHARAMPPPGHGGGRDRRTSALRSVP